MPKIPVCNECGKEIALFSKYAKHENGTILCEKCFKKLKKKGVIG